VFLTTLRALFNHYTVCITIGVIASLVACISYAAVRCVLLHSSEILYGELRPVPARMLQGRFRHDDGRRSKGYKPWLGVLRVSGRGIIGPAHLRRLRRTACFFARGSPVRAGGPNVRPPKISHLFRSGHEQRRKNFVGTGSRSSDSGVQQRHSSAAAVQKTKRRPRGATAGQARSLAFPISTIPFCCRVSSISGNPVSVEWRLHRCSTWNPQYP